MSQLKRAISLAQSGQTDRAVEILRQLTATNPDDMYAWLWLAECTTDSEEARQAAKTVLKMRPTNQRALLILETLGDEAGLDQLQGRRSPKRKHDEPRNRSRRNQALVFGGFGVSVLVVLLAFIFLTNPAGRAFFSIGDSDSANASGDKVSEKENDAQAEDTTQNPIEVDDWDDVDPESLTIQWFEGIITGEQEADVSWSCGEEPSGLQKTLEPFAERLLEYGVRQTLRLIQLDAVFSTVGVMDGTAEYEVDGKIVVEILGQRIESPEFSTIIRFVSDGSQWAICEVTN